LTTYATGVWRLGQLPKGTLYLAEQPGHRDAIAKQLSDLYNLRSRLVHGGSHPDAAQITSARDSADEFARRGLLRAVEQGFPTAATFKELVLGTATP